MNKLLKVIKEPRLAILQFVVTKPFRLLPDSLYLKLVYKLRMKRKLNLKNPKSFNEKMQWLKIYDRKKEYTTLVDKLKVREYISKELGEEYLIPLLGVYNSFDDINFDELPKQFVLKPNHTSGDVYICKDKNKINYTELKKDVNQWLRKQYFWQHREWPYKNITPKIICEKYMVNKDGKEINDYKLMSFNGKVKCSFICSNRGSESGLNVDFYDTDWNLMPFERYYPNSGISIPKPRYYNKMVEFTEKLTKDKVFLRVDFYEIDNRLYFGELTFYPGSGFESFAPEAYDYKLGSWIKLNG